MLTFILNPSSYVTLMLMSNVDIVEILGGCQAGGASAGINVTVMLPCLCQDASSEPRCSQHVYFAPSEPNCSQHVEFAPSEPCCLAGWVAKMHLPEPSC